MNKKNILEIEFQKVSFRSSAAFPAEVEKLTPIRQSKLGSTPVSDFILIDDTVSHGPTLNSQTGILIACIL